MLIRPAIDADVSALNTLVTAVSRERAVPLATEGFAVEQTRGYLAHVRESAASPSWHSSRSVWSAGWMSCRDPSRASPTAAGSAWAWPQTRAGMAWGAPCSTARSRKHSRRDSSRTRSLCVECSGRGLYRRVGFVEEGRRRRARCLDGADDDILTFGLLRDEWPGGTFCVTRPDRPAAQREEGHRFGRTGGPAPARQSRGTMPSSELRTVIPPTLATCCSAAENISLAARFLGFVASLRGGLICLSPLENGRCVHRGISRRLGLGQRGDGLSFAFHRLFLVVQPRWLSLWVLRVAWYWIDHDVCRGRIRVWGRRSHGVRPKACRSVSSGAWTVGQLVIALGSEWSSSVTLVGVILHWLFASAQPLSGRCRADARVPALINGPGRTPTGAPCGLECAKGDRHRTCALRRSGTGAPRRGEKTMLNTIAVVLLILWLLGLVSGYTIVTHLPVAGRRGGADPGWFGERPPHRLSVTVSSPCPDVGQ